MNAKASTASGGARTSEDSALELSLVNAALGLLRDWKILLAVLLLSWAAGVAAFFLMEREYESVALLRTAAETEDGGLSGLAGRLSGVAAIAGINLPKADVSADLAVATLNSRYFIGQFIAEHNLWPDLFPDAWNAATNDWAVPASERPTAQDAYERFIKAIRITTDRQTGLMTMTVRWRDREKAAGWLASLVKDLNAVLRINAEEEARNNLRFLNAELERTATLEVQQSIYAMMETQINKVMLTNVREDYALRVVDPPVVSDADKYVSPNKVMVAFLTTFVGLILGVMVVVAVRTVQHRRSIAG